MSDKPQTIMGIPIVFVDKLADLPEPEGPIIVETPNAVHYVSGSASWIVPAEPVSDFCPFQKECVQAKTHESK